MQLGLGFCFVSLKKNLMKINFESIGIRNDKKIPLQQKKLIKYNNLRDEQNQSLGQGTN